MNSTLKKVIGEADLEHNQHYLHDHSLIQHLLGQVKMRFIKDRTEGYTDPESGAQVPPCSQQEAEARWEAVAPRFDRVFRADKPNAKALRTKIGATGSGQAMRYKYPELQ
jgi:hypothetical protein